MPKVSIIVPCYGVEKYLDRCMESLINQTLRDIEIILVDDVSPDKVPEMCDDWAKRDSRVKVVHKAQNEGLGYARNSGIEVATGEYLAFVDSDDFVDIQMYEKLYEDAKKNCTDATFCGYYMHEDDKNIEKSACKTNNILSTRDACLNQMCRMVDTHIPLPNFRVAYSAWHGIYSRYIFTEYNVRFCSEREFISEDIVFHVDFIFHASRLSVIPYCGYYYCLNPMSLTQSYKPNRFDKDIILCEEVERRMKRYGIPNVEQYVNGMVLTRARDSFSYIVNKSHQSPLSELRKALRDPLLIRALKNYDSIKLGFKYYMFVIAARLQLTYIVYAYYKWFNEGKR